MVVFARWVLYIGLILYPPFREEGKYEKQRKEMSRVDGVHLL